MTEQKWFETSYRRTLLDMHIDSWDPAFLSNFRAETYFQALKTARIQTVMVYVQSHVGLCYWESESGQCHPAFVGNNQIKTLIDLCHADGMSVVAYYSLVFNNWAYEHYPDWRMLDWDGKGSREEGSRFIHGKRYGLICPNNADYRAFTQRQIDEFCTEYDFEGAFFDMTFWSTVCHCPSCRARYRQEAGREIPLEINWADPDWLRFQAARERWMGEFAAFCTGHLRKRKPGATVEHQFSTVVKQWQYGVNHNINDACDYAGGDLYGGHLQESFICKLYYEITNNQPFEFMTSRCDPYLSDHTTTKSLEAMRLHNYLTLAHHGAFLVIDAIDPDGSIHPEVYQMVGDMFAETMRYEPFLKGRLLADVGVYFNQESRMNIHNQGWDAVIPEGCAQLEANVGAASALAAQHIPYTVIPDCRIERIADMHTLVISEAPMLSDVEIERIAQFVAAGGGLFIGGSTNPKLAAKLLGLEFEGYTAETVTYIAPTEAGLFQFGPYSDTQPVACRHRQQLARNPQNHTVLATVTLPHTLPQDSGRFAAIHSNPPGNGTGYPSVILGSYGNGKVVWSASVFEKNPQQAQKQVFANLLSMLDDRPPLLQSNAHPVVEFTVFEDKTAGRCYLHCINVQDRLPSLSVGDFTVSLRVDAPVREVRLLPDRLSVAYHCQHGILTLSVAGMELFQMYEILLDEY